MKKNSANIVQLRALAYEAATKGPKNWSPLLLQRLEEALKKVIEERKS